MHPVGPWPVEQKIILPLLASLQQRHRQVRNAIHRPGRCQPVPVNERVLIRPIGQIDVKIVTGIEAQAMGAIRLHEPEDLGRTAIDINGARRYFKLRDGQHCASGPAWPNGGS